MRRYKFLVLMFAFAIVACGNINGSTHNTNDESSEMAEKQTKSISFYRDLLEEFCKVHYHEMFEGRAYIYTSLHIDECKEVAPGIVDVNGIHAYEGRFGKRYDGFKFKANIREMNGEPNTFYIIFEKEGIKPITHRKYWESSSKTFVFKNL